MKHLLLSLLGLALLNLQLPAQSCPAHNHGGKGKTECSPENCHPQDSEKTQEKSEEKEKSKSETDSNDQPAKAKE